jgi:hypothetical protein
MNKYNVWNKWDKLKTVMLGATYAPEFYRDIKNDRIRNALQRISRETQEDLAYFEKVLVENGVEVIRPELDPADSIMNYTDEAGNLTNVPPAPLQPRDSQLILGNNILYQGLDMPGNTLIKDKLDEYNNTSVIRVNKTLTKEVYNTIRCYISGDWPEYNAYMDNFNNESYFLPHVWKEITEHRDLYGSVLPHIHAPQFTLLGKDLYIDNRIYPKDYKDKWEENKAFAIAIEEFANHPYIAEHFRVNEVNIGGHNDGIFNAIKPGAILSLENVQRYADTFPGWDVCYLPGQSWDKVRGFLKHKDKVNGKWWVPGEEDNDEFTDFVESWLQDWVGFCEETVFDVNCLVLDKEHVFVSQMNDQVNEFLAKHNMTPIHIPWRHRYFWDGGLHCITLDLEREGKQEDLFINRTDSVTCMGY